MIVYLVEIFIILLLGLGLHPNTSRQGRKVFLWVSFLILTLISGLRDVSVGVDTQYYVRLFKNIDVYDFAISRYEQGFLYFLKGIHTISSNTTFFLMICSIICIGVTCIFLDKHCEDVVLGLLLYIVLKAYFSQMTLIRQAISTALTMLAFSVLLEKNTLRRKVFAGILILIASSMHTLAASAFIPFVIWIWPSRSIIDRIVPSNILKWTFILTIGVFVSYPLIMRLITVVVPQYAVYFYGRWSDSNYNASLFKFLIQFVFLFVGVLYIRQKEEISDLDRFALLMSMISVIVLTLSMRMEIWGRLAGLFSGYTAILWAPSFTSAVKDYKNRSILKTSVFFFSLLYMIVTFVFRPEWDGVVPYIFG